MTPLHALLDRARRYVEGEAGAELGQFYACVEMIEHWTRRAKIHLARYAIALAIGSRDRNQDGRELVR